MSSLPIRFGTDGVRARVGDWPITPEGAHRIGLGVGAQAVDAQGVGAVVFIGRDPRASGQQLADALARGLSEAGAQALHLGVVPTAAVSCAVHAREAAGGVMVTASHNPAHDNGIKVLAAGGGKLSKAAAADLEARFESPPTLRAGGAVGGVDAPLAPWEKWLPQVDLSGLTLMVDAAHGAGHACAARALEARGARVVKRGCSPDGHNINDGVGALHPPSADLVGESGAQLAICLDGDADRVLFVDPTHGVLDGDDLLWMMAARIDGPVVGTVMSNGGLGAALEDRLLRSKVGDANVAALMRTAGARLGAETSGHVLFDDGMPTGDGLYAALRLLKATGTEGVAQLPLPSAGWTRWPVEKTNIRFRGPRVPLSALTTQADAEAAGNRTVVRYSGTEPKLRILVEGMFEPAAHVAAIAAQFHALLAARPQSPEAGVSA